MQRPPAGTGIPIEGLTTTEVRAFPMADPQVSAPACAQGVLHVRTRHRDRFTVVGNHLAQHRALTLTAIGLAVHIQSLPDGARVDIKSLAERFPEGETRIASALRELEAHGYLSRTRRRLPGGRIVTRTVAYDRPPGTGRHTPVAPGVRPVRATPAGSPVAPVIRAAQDGDAGAAASRRGGGRSRGGCRSAHAGRPMPRRCPSAMPVS
jgi:hypothetical protein